MADDHVDLVAALRDAGRDLDLPPAGDPAAAALARLRQVPARAADPATTGPALARGAPAAVPGRVRRRWLAAAAAAAALAVVLAAPGARQAVARLLGIGGVRITVTGDPPGDLGRALDLGRPLPVDEAVASAGDALAQPIPASPGEPALAFAGRPPGSVSLVWRPSDGLPALEGSEAGLVVTVLPAAGEAGGPAGEVPGAGGAVVEGPVVDKHGGPGTRVTAVRVGPHPGYWLSGAPHEVRDAASGGGTRLAGNTLIWSDGEITYRLESALDLAAAVALAEGITGAGD